MLLKANLCILTVVALLGGCASEQPAPPEQHPRSTQIAMKRYDRIGERNIVAFNRAVQMASELRYKAAAGEFSRLLPILEQAGAVRWTAEATFWIGFCHEKQSRSADAKAFYSRCVQKYPDSPAASLASQRLDRLHPPPRPVLLTGAP